MTSSTSSTASFTSATLALMGLMAEQKTSSNVHLVVPLLEQALTQINPWEENEEDGLAVVDWLVGSSILPSNKERLLRLCANHPAAPHPSTWKERLSFVPVPSNTRKSPALKPWPHILMSTSPSLVTAYTELGGSIEAYDDEGISPLAGVRLEAPFLDQWFEQAQKENMDLLLSEGEKSWQERWQEENPYVSVSEFSSLQRTLNDLRKKYPVSLPPEVLEKQNRKEFLRASRKVPGKSVLASTAKLSGMDKVLTKDASYFKEFMYAALRGFAEEVNFGHGHRPKQNYALTSLKFVDSLYQKYHAQNPDLQFDYQVFCCFFAITNLSTNYLYTDPLRAWNKEKADQFASELKKMTPTQIQDVFVRTYTLMTNSTYAPVAESVEHWRNQGYLNDTESLEKLMSAKVCLAPQTQHLDWLSKEAMSSKPPIRQDLLGEQLMMFMQKFATHEFYLRRSPLIVQMSEMEEGKKPTPQAVFWMECLDRYLQAPEFDASLYPAVEGSRLSNPLVVKIKSLMEKHALLHAVDLDRMPQTPRRKMKM